MTEQRPWELKDKEIARAKRINPNYPKDEPIFALAKPWEIAIAQAAQRKLVEWLEREIILVASDGVVFVRQDQTLVKEKWQALRREVGLE